VDHDLLCESLRRRLAADPANALRLWRETFNRGLRLEAARRLDHAEMHARCALELAYLMLSHSRRGEGGAVVRYSHSALLLVRVRAARDTSATVVPAGGVADVQPA